VAEVAETAIRRLMCCGLDALVDRWDRSINVDGGFVEK
jgi:hypothetical protein